MIKPLFAIAALSIATGLGGCTSTNTTSCQAITTEKLEPAECGNITRLHTFDGIFLASQPQPEDFAQAKDSGIQTVINIRHENEIIDFDEPKIVADLGLEYISLPWKKTEELTDDVFAQTRHLLNTAERPILLHCSSSNRVGAVWIPWRVLDGGLNIEEAVAEAKTIGLRTPALEQRARDYIARHRNP